MSKNWLVYSLYAGVAAAIFEEIGRLFVFKYLLRKESNIYTSIAYGIGYGCSECICVVGINYFIILLYLLGFKTDGVLFNSFENKINEIYIFFVVFERILALVLHICLSILVYLGSVRKMEYIFYAIFLHFIIDFLSATYQREVLNIYVFEVIYLLLSIFVLIFTIRCYKKEIKLKNDIA